MKSLKISTEVKTTILVFENECLIRWLNWNDHSETMFMMFNRLPEKSLNFRKFENCSIWSILISGASELYWNSCCLKLPHFFNIVKKDGTVLATGNQFDGLLNWVCYSIVYGKISFAPLHILNSVYTPIQISSCYNKGNPEICLLKNS